MSDRIGAASRQALQRLSAYLKQFPHKGLAALLVAASLSAGSAAITAALGYLPVPVAASLAVSLLALGTSLYTLWKFHRGPILAATPEASAPEEASPLEEILAGLDLPTESPLEDVPSEGSAPATPADAIPEPSLADAVRDGQLQMSLVDIHTLPHRKPGLLQARLVMSGVKDVPSQLALDQVTLAHAIAHVSRDNSRPVLIKVAPESLGDDEFVQGLNVLALRAPQLKSLLVFELPTQVFSRPSASERDLVETLRFKGFQCASSKSGEFSVADFIGLKSHWSSFTYLKMSVEDILAVPDDVLPLVDSMSIQLIATDTGTDAQAVELIDRKIPFAMGKLFGTESEIQPAEASESNRPLASASKKASAQKTPRRAQPKRRSASPKAATPAGEKATKPRKTRAKTARQPSA